MTRANMVATAFASVPKSERSPATYEREISSAMDTCREISDARLSLELALANASAANSNPNSHKVLRDAFHRLHECSALLRDVFIAPETLQELSLYFDAFESGIVQAETEYGAAAAIQLAAAATMKADAAFAKAETAAAELAKARP